MWELPGWAQPRSVRVLGLVFMGVCSRPRPYRRLNPDYERLKIQCVRAMSDLQSLQNQHTNALKRCEEVAKETDFYQ